MMQAIQPYLESIVSALIGILAVAAIAGMKFVKQKISDWSYANTTQAQRATIHLLAAEGWAFAEKMYGELKGEEKLNQALMYVTHQAQLRGIPIDADVVHAAIEKVVLDYNAVAKPKPTSVPESPAN